MIIHRRFHVLEGLFHHHRAKLRRKRAHNLSFQHGHYHFGCALDGLQEDVADKTVAYKHVVIAAERVASFHIADEIYRQFLELGKRFMRKRIAFLVLDAN